MSVALMLSQRLTAQTWELLGLQKLHDLPVERGTPQFGSFWDPAA